MKEWMGGKKEEWKNLHVASHCHYYVQMTQHKYMYKHKKKLSFSWNSSFSAIFMLLS